MAAPHSPGPSFSRIKDHLTGMQLKGVIKEDRLTGYDCDHCSLENPKIYVALEDYQAARSNHDARGFPADALYWESVVAHCEFRRESLHSLTLHPIDLGHSAKRSQRGRPLFAGSDVSRRALERIKRLSRPLGTDIRIDRGVGKARF